MWFGCVGSSGSLVAFLDELMSSVDDNHDQVLTFDEMVKGTLCDESNTLCVYLLPFLVPNRFACRNVSKMINLHSMQGAAPPVQTPYCTCAIPPQAALH